MTPEDAWCLEAGALVDYRCPETDMEWRAGEVYRAPEGDGTVLVRDIRRAGLPLRRVSHEDLRL